MKRYRPVISVLLGLVFLLQGIAVVAAPRGVQSDALQSAATVDEESPCHDILSRAPNAGAPSCCGDHCPDMSSCVLGFVTLNSAAVSTQPPQPNIAPDSPAVRSAVRMHARLLRPPIPLHA